MTLRCNTSVWSPGGKFDPPSFFATSLPSVLPPEGAQTFQLWVLCLFSLALSPSSLCCVCGKVFQESSINVRAEEPRVRVSFHQPVNYLLSVIKAVHGGSLDVPFDLLSGVIVDVDLG